jgi:O-antigen/teichoic acid export membrane protein
VTVELDTGPGSAPPRSRFWDRCRRWAGILAAFFTFQTAVQVSGILAGLLVVRSLSVVEFAQYALATSLLGFLVLVSNLGASSALVFYFRETAHEPTAFGRYYRAVLSVRRMLLAGVLPAVAVGFLWMGGRNGFPRGSLALCLLVVAADALVLISVTGQTTSLRLHTRSTEAYRAELAGAVTRLVLVAAVLGIGWRWAVPALLATVAGDFVARVLSRPGSHPGESDTGVERRRIWRYLAPTLPSEVFAAFQGPLILWVAAVAGSTQGVAEVGALSRLAQLFALLSTLAALVFLPRLAAIPDDDVYRERFLQFAAALAGLAAAILIACWFGADLLLLALGSGYAGLRREMLLSVATSGIVVLASYGIWVNAARSWKRWQIPLALATVAFQAAYVVSFPFRTTADFLWFGLWSAAVMAVAQLGNAVVGCYRPRWVRW